MKYNHYNALVNGDVEQIEPDGNCMFNSILLAMGKKDATQFQRAMREQYGDIPHTFSGNQLLRATLAKEVKTNLMLAEKIVPYLAPESVPTSTQSEQHTLVVQSKLNSALSLIHHQLNTNDKKSIKEAMHSLIEISSIISLHESPTPVLEKNLELLMIATTQQQRGTEVINILADSKPFIGKKQPGFFRAIMKKKDPTLSSNLDLLLDATMNGKLTRDTWQKASKLKEALMALSTLEKLPYRDTKPVKTTELQRSQSMRMFRNQVDVIASRGLFTTRSMRKPTKEKKVKEKHPSESTISYQQFR